MADDKLTIKTARQELAEIGYSLRRVDGEFRVAPRGGDDAQREARAYYTDDLGDALGTAKAERSRIVLSDAAWSVALTRTMESSPFTDDPQPQGRDADNVSQYPGERLIYRFAGPVRDDEFDR